MQFANDFEEALFRPDDAGDDRTVQATYVAGELKYSRSQDQRVAATSGSTWVLPYASLPTAPCWASCAQEKSFRFRIALVTTGIFAFANAEGYATLLLSRLTITVELVDGSTSPRHQRS